MEQFCKENWKQYAKKINGKIDEKYRHIEAGCGFMPKEPERINEGFFLSGFVSEANAALIAAAPDLYEALQGAEAMLREAEKQFRQHGDNAHANMCALHEKQAKEALAKARNEIQP